MSYCAPPCRFSCRFLKPARGGSRSRRGRLVGFLSTGLGNVLQSSFVLSFRGNVVVRDVAAARRLSPRRHRSGGREEVDRRRFSVVGASPSRSSLKGLEFELLRSADSLRTRTKHGGSKWKIETTVKMFSAFFFLFLFLFLFRFLFGF